VFLGSTELELVKNVG